MEITIPITLMVTVVARIIVVVDRVAAMAGDTATDKVAGVMGSHNVNNSLGETFFHGWS